MRKFYKSSLVLKPDYAKCITREYVEVYETPLYWFCVETTTYGYLLNRLQENETIQEGIRRMNIRTKRVHKTEESTLTFNKKDSLRKLVKEKEVESIRLTNTLDRIQEFLDTQKDT